MSASKLFVGTRKGLFVIEKQNGTWKIVNSAFLGVQVPIVLATAGGETLFACLKHGHFGSKVHRSIDGGATWQEVAVPKYPEKPEHVPDVMDPMRGTPIPWSLDMIWSLEQGSDGLLWCGTLPGGLFVSKDQGESWVLNESLWFEPERSKWFGGGYDLPGIHSICVDPIKPQHVKVAISCGGVWSTMDGGETWECTSAGMRAEYMPPEQAYEPSIQDPHRMVQCPSAPDYHWVQHHNGIFRSIDNCRNWVEIPAPKPSGFGFAVAVHPRNPLIAWFVPAVKDSDRYPVDGKFVVTRTSDGGATFEVLDRGLPGENAYHLVYRHGLDVSSEGEVLAMGSTTGHLWISEDLGESWEEVCCHLPPIFHVRFASR
jgi:hypothetical protein